MEVSRHDKALAALLLYAQGANITDSCRRASLSIGCFYDELDASPDVAARYEKLQQRRGHILLAEAERIVTDEDDPKRLRARVDALLKIVAMLNPSRFGDRLNLQVEQKVSVVGALELAKQRAALPVRDLTRIVDVQAIDVTPRIAYGATDSQSVAPAANVPNPFDD